MKCLVRRIWKKIRVSLTFELQKHFTKQMKRWWEVRFLLFFGVIKSKELWKEYNIWLRAGKKLIKGSGEEKNALIY